MFKKDQQSFLKVISLKKSCPKIILFLGLRRTIRTEEVFQSWSPIIYEHGLNKHC